MAVRTRDHRRWQFTAVIKRILNNGKAFKSSSKLYIIRHSIFFSFLFGTVLDKKVFFFLSVNSFFPPICYAEEAFEHLDVRAVRNQHGSVARAPAQSLDQSRPRIFLGLQQAHPAWKCDATCHGDEWLHRGNIATRGSVKNHTVARGLGQSARSPNFCSSHKRCAVSKTRHEWLR